MRPLVLFISILSSLHAQEIRREPLTLTQGGTPEKPAVFDGKGMIIDLGIDISGLGWLKSGDLWTTPAPVAGLPAVADVQRAGLFIDEVPIRISRDRNAEKASGIADKVIYTAPEVLQPGQMGWTAEGKVYFRWPLEKQPGTAPVIQPPAGLASCVNIACSHITIRNITARHAANDGFNIHGHRIGIRLENVRAFSNGDEGISAHETVQMEVSDSEIAWNGSSAGGVADVGDSITTYTNCELHHNVNAAFFFDGKLHRVTGCRIHHQDQAVLVRGDAVVEQSDVQWLKQAKKTKSGRETAE
jgi:hypothetical protein